MADKKKNFTSPPTPINLEAPESLEAPKPVKRARKDLSKLDSLPIGMPGREKREAPSDTRGSGVFRAAQRSYGSPQPKTQHAAPRSKMPPPPPPIRPGEILLRRKSAGSVPQKGAKKPTTQRMPSAFRRFLQIRVNPMYVSLVGWGAVGVATIIIAVWVIMNLFVYNAFAVYLDDEFIGHIPYSEDLTSEDFHNYAILSLQASRGGARVLVEQTVTIEPARASSSARSTRNEVFSTLNRRFDYKIAAIQLNVDVYSALMRTASDVAHVEELFQRHWRNENTVGAEFVDGWEIVVVYACPDETEFDTPETAYWRFDRTTMQMYPYTVARGDNLGSIAVHFGTTVPRIMGDNKLTSSNIFPGEVLYIYTSRPLLSVRTFDEISIVELIEMSVEERTNPALPQAVTNIIQQGQPGQQVITVRITRENGIERYRETLEAEVIVPPVVHIIEVGTGAVTLERR